VTEDDWSTSHLLAALGIGGVVGAQTVSNMTLY